MMSSFARKWLLAVMAAVVANMAAAYPAYGGEADEDDMATLMQAIRSAQLEGGRYGGSEYPDIDFLRGRYGGQELDYDILPNGGTEGKLEVVEGWPAEDVELGQVGGLAVDKLGNLHVFHRQDRSWDDNSFDENSNEYLQKDLGAIPNATVYVMDGKDGEVTDKWGANRFFMPHGLTIDPEGNYWLTDVALHQVFKFDANNRDTPSVTLGKAFEAAKDNDDIERFCKPTAVAVSSRGDVFIADGYCNSRIVKYTSSGEYVTMFGEDEFWVPHSLALAEDMNLLCVADRENQRILCFNAGLDDPEELGTPEREYKDADLGRVFAIAYSPKDGLLYGVNGTSNVDPIPTGFTIDLKQGYRSSGNVLAQWSPDDSGFEQPHALAVCPDGESVFVGEIGPNNVWKFEKPEDEK